MPVTPQPAAAPTAPTGQVVRAPDSGLLLARMPLSPAEGRGRKKQPKDRGDLPEELLALIVDDDVLGESLPYLSNATASTNRVDSYFTRMRPSSLANYAEDAKAGLAIQNSHNWRELPMGRTYDGRHVTGKNARTDMDFYLPRGLNVNGVNTDDVIRGIQYGTIHDVSIGFTPGRIECSIDGKEMFTDIFAIWFTDPEAERIDPDKPCFHIPGVDYPKRDKDGKKLDSGEREVAIGEVEDGHCHELSLVFDGATPGAEINGRRSPAMEKAVLLDEQGILPFRAAMVLEQRFAGVRFKASQTRIYVPEAPSERQEQPTTTAPEEEHMADTAAAPADGAQVEETVETPQEEARTADGEGTQEPAAQAATDLEAVAAAAGVAGEGAPADEGERAQPALIAGELIDLLGPIRAALVESRLVEEGWDGDISAAAEAIRAAARTLAVERGHADFGRAARAALCGEVEAQAVRALGATWPKAAFRAVFEAGTFEELAELRESFRAQANSRLGGSRVTVEREAPATAPAADKTKPDAAYRARAN